VDRRSARSGDWKANGTSEIASDERKVNPLVRTGYLPGIEQCVCV
jgi:hypothetical protein